MEGALGFNMETSAMVSTIPRCVHVLKGEGNMSFRASSETNKPVNFIQNVPEIVYLIAST